MTDVQTFLYKDIPGFPLPSVAGHKGELVFGYLSGIATVCLRGRFHSYEGHPQAMCALPVRVMRCLGCKLVIITNAAGGLNPSYSVGDVAVIMDHLALPNLCHQNPLVGHNDEELGPRFPPMSNAYDENLQNVVLAAAERLGYDWVRKNGTYCFVSGPMYESRAESRFLLSAGGDTVGMSTVPEVVAAHHCGLKVLCLSLVTNKVVMPGAGADEGAANHEEVLDAVNMRGEGIKRLVIELVKDLKTPIEDMDDLPPIDLSKNIGSGSGSGSGSGWIGIGSGGILGKKGWMLWLGVGLVLGAGLARRR